MSSESIIRISLAPGISGFYDEITGTHLTLSRRECDIDKTLINLIGIIKAIKDGKIVIVSGSIDSGIIDYSDYHNPSNLRLFKNLSSNKNKPLFQESKKNNNIIKAIEEKVEVVCKESSNDTVIKESSSKDLKVEPVETTTEIENKEEEVVIQKEKPKKSKSKKKTPKEVKEVK